MKLTILFTVLSVFKLTANGFAQHVSLTVSEAPLIEVMQTIKKQSGVPFLLNGKELANTRITIDVKDMPLQNVLKNVVEGKPIGWEITDGTIIIRRLKEANLSNGRRFTQQQRIVTGRVADERGQPIRGASVHVVGTDQGTVTDEEGNFSVTLTKTSDAIRVSSVGFLPVELPIENQKVVRVTLKASLGDLDEVVVVGYGTQKKKLTTGASVHVKGDDLQKLSTPSILEAMQSQSPGVQITQNSGMPGESFKVIVRGLGTVVDFSPLYVIDGVTGGDINMLNPSDIESIDVLKDAASAAIYGSRAANGVVLVTTKQGREGRTAIHLDNYVGFQNAYKLPALLNAREYMAIQDERRFNEGAEPYDWATLIPKQYGQIMDGSWNGTNWLKEIHNDNAVLHNTAINMMGGSERSRFSVGYSLSNRDGVMGVPVEPNFQRHTARINSEHVLLKNDDFTIIKFGENVNYGFIKKSGIGIGNIYWNDIHNMLVGNPLMPVHNEKGTYYDQASKMADQWTFDGATANPIADMHYRRGQNLSKSHSLSANTYLEIQPMKGLIFKSNFGYRLNASSYRQYTPTFALSTTLTNPIDDISQNQEMVYKILWENTVSYLFKPVENHQMDMVVGQSIEKEGLGENLSVTTANSSFPGQWDKAWVGNGQGYDGFIPTVGGIHLPEFRIASYFGRVNYNIKETYMATLILRADASSNFAKGYRWGYFPSASIGWVMTNEEFLKDHAFIDFMKLRMSWGQNGNASIPAFQYLPTISIDNKNGYYFGNNKTTLNRGAYADVTPTPDISWETSEQFNIGLDARFLNNKLAFVFDWYKKSTKDWLVSVPVLRTYGTLRRYVNGGDVENEGIEIGLNWNDSKGDFRYGIGINGAYNKNKVLRIANNEGIIRGVENVLSQSTQHMYRAQEGYPIGYFYGFKTGGIFQTQEQIEALRATGHGVLPNAQPGDVIFVDQNRDGRITDDDKTMIGNPHPDFSGGLNLNLGYKGIDLSVTAIGSFGHQIMKSYRSFADSPLQNYTTDIFERWHGEGTSNKLPRLTSGSHTNNLYISDIYMENAGFVKLQNITLGYDFKQIWKNTPFSQFRCYATVQNVFTFTKYSGMDPEIGYGDVDPWASGIDVGFYPQPRTVMFGVNLKF